MRTWTRSALRSNSDAAISVLVVQLDLPLALDAPRCVPDAFRELAERQL
jgi:hypothetical protein